MTVSHPLGRYVLNPVLAIGDSSVFTQKDPIVSVREGWIANTRRSKNYDLLGLVWEGLVDRQ